MSTRAISRTRAILFRHLAIVALIVIHDSPSSANDAEFGGTGGTVAPLKNTNVAMSEERLHFRLERDETHLGSRHWNVSVEYIFKNTSEKVVKLTMGFPYQLVYTGGVLKDGTGAVAPYIEAFQVSINQNSLPNDQITTVRFKELFGQRGINTSWKKGQWKTTDEDFARYEAYTWKASFLPLETVRIAHTYKTRASTGIGRPFMVDYILRTGGLWKGGRIGRAMIEVETGSAFRPCDKTEHFLTAMRDFKPSFLDTAHKSTPKGSRIIGTGANTKLVWEFSYFLPTEDVHVCLVSAEDFAFSVLLLGATELITQAQDAKSALPLQFGQLAELRNTAYAAHGKIFSLPNLDSFFRRQWWYRPNAKYTDALLTKEGRQLLNMIAVEERRLATKPTE